MNTDPGPVNDWLAAHAELLLRSYRHWLGKDLIDAGLGAAGRAEALYRAPFVVLSHDGADDPRFTYANLAAQRLFEMSWAEIVGLPSRYSAEAPARVAREHLLRRVAEHGYIDDYQGVRVAKSGRRFNIEGATVWNLIDAHGEKIGQAATFSTWWALP